jgi:hypothetical protein
MASRSAKKWQWLFLNVQLLRLPPSQGAQLAQFGGRGRRLGRFLPLADALRVDVERPGRSLGRAALRGQAQGFGTEGRVVFAALVGFWRVFHDEGKTPP